MNKHINKHINKKIVEVLTKNFIHRNFNNKENGILRPIAIQHIELCYDIIINNDTLSSRDLQMQLDIELTKYYNKHWKHTSTWFWRKFDIFDIYPNGDPKQSKCLDDLTKMIYYDIMKSKNQKVKTNKLDYLQVLNFCME